MARLAMAPRSPANGGRCYAAVVIRIEDQVEVAASADDAFAFVTRVEDYPTWLPSVLRAEPTGGPTAPAGHPAEEVHRSNGAPDRIGLTPGAAFRLVSAGPGGIEIVSAGVVDAVDPPRSISISASSGFFGLTASCEVTELGDGRSRITVRAAVEPRGLATLVAGRIEQELRASAPDTLRRLREALEGPPAG